jgi:hypothetical protein
VDIFRLMAAAIATCAGAAQTHLLPPPERVYAVDGVMCTVMQCMLDDPAVMHTMCCVRAIHTEFPYPPRKKPKPPPGSPPETLAREHVVTGMAPVKAHLAGCQSKHGAAHDGAVRERLRLRMVVAPDGTVEHAALDPPSADARFDACILAAAQRARFATSREGVRFAYPITR